MVGAPVAARRQTSGRGSTGAPKFAFLAAACAVAAVGVALGLRYTGNAPKPAAVAEASLERTNSTSTTSAAAEGLLPASASTLESRVPTATFDSSPLSSETSRPKATALATETTSTAATPTCKDDGSWGVAGPVILPPLDCPATPFGRPSVPEDNSIHSGWVVLLDAEPIDDPVAIQQYYSAAARAGFEPRLLDSRKHLGLRDPYWTVVIGPYAYESEALSWCAKNWSASFSDDGSCKARRLDTQPPTAIDE